MIGLHGLCFCGHWVFMLYSSANFSGTGQREKRAFRRWQTNTILEWLGMRLSNALYLIGLLAVSAMASDQGGDAAAGKTKAAACAACHGADGNSTNPEWPKLAGQGELYLYRQLSNFKNNKREAALMAGPVAALSDQDMKDLAAYFSSQTRTPGSADPVLVSLGEQVYRGGDEDRGVSSCMGCHGPTGAGNVPAGFPALSGQQEKYVVNQLRAYRDGLRRTDPSAMMRDNAGRMSNEEIEAVASYIAGLH
jgi:cytochrome c553